MLDYLYHQMRQDFVCGRVPELHQSKVQSRTLGLVITDVVRHLIELGQNPQQGSYSFRSPPSPITCTPPVLTYGGGSLLRMEEEL